MMTMCPVRTRVWLDLPAFVKLLIALTLFLLLAAGSCGFGFESSVEECVVDDGIMS